jgi:hypothetical protein
MSNLRGAAWWSPDQCGTWEYQNNIPRVPTCMVEVPGGIAWFDAWSFEEQLWAMREGLA